MCLFLVMPPEPGYFHSRSCYLVLGLFQRSPNAFPCFHSCFLQPILHSEASDLFKAEVRLIIPCFKPPKPSHHSRWNPKLLLWPKRPYLIWPCLPASWHISYHSLLIHTVPAILSFFLGRSCTHQTCSHLKTFTVVIPSAWMLFTQVVPWLDSFHPLSSSLNCHSLKETLDDHSGQKIVPSHTSPSTI